ncbi:MAG: hypothetical protein ACFFD4_13985 [Candidatus Odinarchaeota archaeon]
MTSKPRRTIEELVFIVNSYRESGNILHAIVGGTVVLFRGRMRTTVLSFEGC